MDALGFISGGLGNLGNIASTLINNHHNEQLIQEQNRLNIEQWNRENLFNSPVEQMKRLKAAGLNPNLIYGNGAGSFLSAASPEIQAAQTIAPQVDPLVLSQIELNKSQANKNNSDATRSNSLLPFDIKKLQADTDHTLHLISLVDSQKSKTDADVYLSKMLGKKARAEAMEHFENYRYLSNSLGYRLSLIQNQATREGLESVKLNEELNYYGDILKQTLVNLQKQQGLIQAESFRAYKEGYAAEKNAKSSWENSLSYRNATNNQAIAITNEKRLRERDQAIRLQELAAQIERWDDMTTNERLQMVTSIVNSLISLGGEVYTGSQSVVTETKKLGGGRPSSTTTTTTSRR